MRGYFVVLAAYALLGCKDSKPVAVPEAENERLKKWYDAWAVQQPRPTEQLVSHIEAKLIGSRCIGELSNWARFYAFARLPEKVVDTGIVNFHLEKAGADGVVPGRRITEPDSWVTVDDRRIKMAMGDYDLKEDRIRVASCGNNVGAPGTDAIDNFDAYFNELKKRRLAHARVTSLDAKSVTPMPPNAGNAASR